MAISSIGVGSGLPLGELLNSLRASQEQQLDVIKARQNKQTARISAYGQLKRELDNLQTAAKALSGEAFGQLKTTMTGTAFTASAKPGAIAADYTIKVQTLAKTQTLVMAGQASKTDQLRDASDMEGTINFTVDGQVKSLDLTGKGSSLNDIVAAINADADLGLSATIVNNGSGTPYQLMVSSKTTGLANAVTAISVSDNTVLDGIMNFGNGVSSVVESAASDAALTLNGVSITSSTNTITDALSGVTLTLTNATGTSETLSVQRDDTAVKKSITDFVSAYNDVHKKIKQLTTYDVATNSGSALTGDSLARSVQTRLASILNTPAVGGSLTLLSDIGIRTTETGLLEVKDDMLTKALSENLAGVKALFQDPTGVVKRTTDIAATFTQTDGLLDNATEGATKSRDDLEKQYTSAQARIDAQMEIYRQQYTAMDALVAQMNSTGSYLTQQLSLLGKKS